jgi:hypothetical protein
MADGIAVSQRVDGLTERKLHGKVIDSVLNSRTYFARQVARAVPMLGKTYDVTHKISRTNAGQWFVGLENLNSSAWNTKITQSFAHAAYSHPVPSIMQEAFANAGQTGTIDLDLNNLEEAKGELIQDLGAAMYGLGTANQILGLETIVDDGTNTDSVGGVSRTTYPALNAYVLAAAAGVMSLARLATTFDGASAAGIASEEPNIGIMTKAEWAFFEQLIAPQMRNNYKILPIMADTSSVVARENIAGALGFSTVYFRGIPMIKDDACTTGVTYFLNEKYIKWMGRTIVPDQYKNEVKKIDLGTPKTFEGTMAAKEYMPSSANGFFYTPYMLLPSQAGKIARYYMFGQLVPLEFRRHSKLTGVTGV